jgi:hypothetical protein
MTRIIMSAVLAASIIFSGCHNPASRADAEDSNRTAPAPVYHPQKLDANPSKPPGPDSLFDDGNPEPTLGQIVADYQKTCRDTIRIDTQLVRHDRVFHIQLTHYSNGDSLITLPQNILDRYHFKKFVTSDFQTRLRVGSSDTILIDTIIRSIIFQKYVYPNIAKSGVLFFNGPGDIEYLPERIHVEYSYSIPLTDLGTGVSFEYSLGGKLVTHGDNTPSHP